MKTFTILLLSTLVAFIVTFFITPNLFAFDVPDDAIIKVFNKSGKQIGEMTRKRFKVVKIKKKKLKKPTLKTVVVKETIVVKEAGNTFTFHSGIGPNGLDVNNNSTEYKVYTRKALVFGGTICSETDICFTGLTNKTYLMGVRINLD